MNYTDYLRHFEQILESVDPPPPYNDAFYIEYTRLNYARMNRWMKTLQLHHTLVDALKAIAAPQHWIIIVEPWCGDVAPSLPFLIKLIEQNELISYELQLRDSEPYLINRYLSNGSKSIPKLIVRDSSGNDLFTWGARPAAAQQLMNEMKAAGTDINSIRSALQNWYNEDKGRSLQQELEQLFKMHQPAGLNAFNE